MSVFKKMFLAISGALPTGWLNRWSDIEVLLPYHHVVSDEYLLHIKGLYDYKNKKQFLNDLEWLLKYRKPVHPDQLAACLLERRPLPSNTFLLTFDDGFREISEVVAPLLYSKGIPAIFFINPAFIDNKEFFYRCKLSLIIEQVREKNSEALTKRLADFLSVRTQGFCEIRKAILQIHYPEKSKADLLGEMLGISFDEYVKANKPFMTSGQLEELSRMGFTLGAHSMDHPHYGLVDQDTQIQQTLKSLQFVRQIKNSSYEYFSFPHEDKAVRQSFFSELEKRTDYPGQTSLFGTQKQLKEINNNMLHRFNAENPQFTVARSFKSVAFYNLLMGFAGRDKIHRS